MAAWCSAQDAPQPGTTVPPAPAAAPATEDPLLQQVDQAIQVNGQRFLVANVHTPWQIFHGILAYRRDFLLKVGDQKMSAITWIATTEPRFDGRPWIVVTPHGGKFQGYTRPYAFEGHPTQFLALLSQSNLPPDFTFKAGDRSVSIADMLQAAMQEVNSREEITWVLWALNHYLKPDATWVNQWGEPWSIEKLIQIELASPVVGRPCGGNHGLFALSRARDKFAKNGQPLRGVWYEAELKIQKFVEIARSLQNSDGSFSSNFYAGPQYSNDINTRFNTTGHTMEFLSVGLPDQRLNEPWVRNAVAVLSRDLIEHRKSPVDCGPLYHSLNALMIYRDRVKPKPAETESAAPKEPAAAPLAERPKSVQPLAAAPQPLVAAPPRTTTVAPPQPTLTAPPPALDPGKLASPSQPAPLAVAPGDAKLFPPLKPVPVDADPAAPKLPVPAATPKLPRLPTVIVAEEAPVSALRPLNRQ